MITEYGMSEKIGPTQFTGGGGDQVFLGRDIQSDQNYSDAIAHAIDQETQKFINECYDRAKEILTTHRDQLELIANTLLEVETLDADEIKSLFEDGVLPEKPEVIESSKLDEAEEAEKADEAQDDKVNIQSKDEEEAKSYEKVKEEVDQQHDDNKKTTPVTEENDETKNN